MRENPKPDTKTKSATRQLRLLLLLLLLLTTHTRSTRSISRLKVIDKSLQRRQPLLLDDARVGIGRKDPRSSHKRRSVPRASARARHSRRGRIPNRETR